MLFNQLLEREVILVFIEQLLIVLSAALSRHFYHAMTAEGLHRRFQNGVLTVCQQRINCLFACEFLAFSVEENSISIVNHFFRHQHTKFFIRQSEKSLLHIFVHIGRNKIITVEIGIDVMYSHRTGDIIVSLDTRNTAIIFRIQL